MVLNCDLHGGYVVITTPGRSRLVLSQFVEQVSLWSKYYVAPVGSLIFMKPYRITHILFVICSRKQSSDDITIMYFMVDGRRFILEHIKSISP